MRKEELISSLKQLGYQLFTPEKKPPGKQQIYEVLAELADSREARIIEAFPVVLANCAVRGINLDVETVLSGHGEKSRKRMRLEKLFLAGAVLLNEQGFMGADSTNRVMETLKQKHGDLLAAENIMLDEKLYVSVERLRNTLRRYTAVLGKSEAASERKKKIQLRSFKLNLHLSTLFPPKQKELVLKKLKGETLTKTEREYYSRVVKKKLEALADRQIHKIATKLTKKV